MSSLNTGLGEFFTNYGNSSGTKNEVSHRIIFAHVLDVVEDEFSLWYQGPDSIGAVRGRILMTGYNKYEDEQDTLLYPLDRTYMRVPFAGEQVVGTVSFGPAEQGTYLMRYYYWKIITADQNITYSGNPFTGTDPYHIKPGLKAMVNVGTEAKRFDDKLPYDKALLTNMSVNQKVRKGERTIESRFGAMIKFTSTPTDASAWDESQVNNQSSPPVMSVGDPLVIIGAHPKTSTSTELTTRDLDINASSNIFLASTQNLPIKLGCSAKLSTFDVDLRLGNLQSATDETATLQTIFGGGYDPTAQVGIALSGVIKIPGSEGSLTPVGSLNEEQVANIQIANGVLAKAGYGWQARVAVMCVCGKEAGFKPKSEYDYDTTAEPGLRKLFGKYLTEFDTKEKLYAISGYPGIKDPAAKEAQSKIFYDYIYGYKCTPPRNGYDKNKKPLNGGNDLPGEGYKYRGRGFNGITFKDAYVNLTKYSKEVIQKDVDFVNNPDALNEVENAAIGLAWFMDKATNGSYVSRYKENSGENVNPKQGTNIDVLIRWFANANGGFGHEWNGEHVQWSYDNSKKFENVIMQLYESNPSLKQ